MVGTIFRHRTFLAGVAILLIIVAPLLDSKVPPDMTPTIAHASSAPTNPAQFYYVQETWSQGIYFNGAGRSYAYAIGYYAAQGQPGSNSLIFLDFGRQFVTTAGIWGTCLIYPGDDYPCTDHFHSDYWVRIVALSFMNGYNDGHTSPSTVSVTTNNGEQTTWQCTEGGTISPNYQIAGARWSNDVIDWLETQTQSSQIVLSSGDDIETFGELGSSACGDGAEAWYNGYQNGYVNPTGTPTPLAGSAASNYDYGSEAYNEDSSAWTQKQVYDVSAGLPLAYGAPSIYCGGINYPDHAKEWVQLRNLYTMQFYGVTSDNAVGDPCANIKLTPVTGLTWSQSWNAFNNELTNNTPTPYPNDLLSDSTAYGLASPTEAPTLTPGPTLTPTP